MNYKHGFAKLGAVENLHCRWRHMLERCKSHPSYAGRGLTVCSEWKEYLPFREWSLNSGYALHLTLDRIDNDKGYSPEKCRWTTAKIQARNRRTSKLITVRGETKTTAEWSEQTGVSQALIFGRINRLGWSEEDAIFILPFQSVRNGRGQKTTDH